MHSFDNRVVQIWYFDLMHISIPFCSLLFSVNQTVFPLYLLNCFRSLAVEMFLISPLLLVLSFLCSLWHMRFCSPSQIGIYQTALVRGGKKSLGKRNLMPIPEKTSAVMEVVEWYIQVNMGFSPSRISFILHLSKDYLAS